MKKYPAAYPPESPMNMFVNVLFMSLAVGSTWIFFVLLYPSFFSSLVDTTNARLILSFSVWVGFLGLLYLGYQKTQRYLREAELNRQEAQQNLIYVSEILTQMVENKPIRFNRSSVHPTIQALVEQLQHQHSQQLEKDNIRRWTVEGIAQFADLLREQRDIKQLGEALIQKLCKYVEAVQGVIMQTSLSNSQELEIIAGYACNDLDQRAQKLKTGSDLVQQVVNQQKPLYIENIPEGFITITTGLVERQPQALAIVPLLLNDQFVGLIELATLKPLSQAEQAFLEQIAERTAATLSVLRQNEQTLKMLDEAQRLTQALKARETELLQSTEQIRQTSAQLIQSQQQLQAITASVPEVIYQLAFDIKNLQYKFLYISARAETLLGLIPEAIIQNNDALRFENQSDFIVALQKSADQLSPLQWQGQIQVNNQWRWFEFSGIPHPDTQSTSVLIWNGTIADITNRRAQEEALKLKESAIESASSGIMIMEVGQTGQLALVSINPAFEKITGYQIHEVKGQSYDFLFSHDTEQAEIKRLEQAIQAGQAIDVLVRSYNKQQQIFWNEMHLSPVQNQTGQITHYVMIINDRTAQKNSEEAMLKSEKLAVLGTLVAGVAHEINTPMGAIKAAGENMREFLPFLLTELPTLLKTLPEEQANLFMNLLAFSQTKGTTNLSTREARNYCNALRQALSEEYSIDIDKDTGDKLVLLGFRSDNPTELQTFLPLLTANQSDILLQAAYNVIQLQKSLQIIEHSAAKTTRIVYALKSYTHFKTEPTLENINLQESLENILILYHHQLKQGIEVTTRFQDVPTIRGYATELEQVWTNIIFNAMQAMNYKGHLTIDLAQAEDNVILRFIDSGPGIPPHVLPRIFEPFFTTKPQGQGTGLGLDICKKIIDKHKGTIEVEETMPGKTVFRVTLPINNETQQAA